MTRVALFIDQQNVYRSARDAYCWWNRPAMEGNFSPCKLAALLTTGALAKPMSESEDISKRELVAVNVYMGMPVSSRDDRNSKRAQRQKQHWEFEHSNVTVFTRALKYPHDWPTTPAREKGVDVMLAIDLIRGESETAPAHTKCDLAILVSADTDLLPAVELVVDLRGHQAIQTVCLKNEPGGTAGAALRISTSADRQQIQTIAIPLASFERVRDTIDHTRPRAETAPRLPFGRAPRPPKG